MTLAFNPPPPSTLPLSPSLHLPDSCCFSVQDRIISQCFLSVVPFLLFFAPLLPCRKERMYCIQPFEEENTLYPESGMSVTPPPPPPLPQLPLDRRDFVSANMLECLN
ncbi:unnamed protein product [Boreogadus saida]